MADIVAIIPVQPGKMDEAIEIMKTMSHEVHENEPEVSRYHCLREIDANDGEENIVMIERYDTQDAFEGHWKTSHFQSMAGSLEAKGLLRGRPIIKRLEHAAGFASR